eukprot:15334366-Alexandrium_andersonii.AAC.1
MDPELQKQRWSAGLGLRTHRPSRTQKPKSSQPGRPPRPLRGRRRQHRRTPRARYPSCSAE